MIEINIGGEARKMRFSHIAIKTLESHFDLPFHEIFENIHVDSIENIGVMLWASLKKYDKQLTLEEVEDWLDDAIDDEALTYAEVNSKVGKALAESTVFKKAGQEKNKKGA
jgi:hypothetical protein